MLLGLSVSAYPQVPPFTDVDCRSVVGSPLASGLIPDVKLGGCKCASKDAEWGKTSLSEYNHEAVKLPSYPEVWACYCEADYLYASYPVTEHDNAGTRTPNDKNRKSCGIIQECQASAILQQSAKWQ